MRVYQRTEAFKLLSLELLAACGAPKQKDPHTNKCTQHKPQTHTHTQQQTRKTRTQVAPGAGIAALDVFASDYGAFDSDVIRGVNWAVRARAAHGVCVINLRCVGGAGGC